jgi:kumamolisin
MNKLIQLTFFIFIGFSVYSRGQTPPPLTSSATDRITFTDSIKAVSMAQPQVGAGAFLTLVRSELTQPEAEARLDFSIALKMRHFAELNERIGRGEIISLDEMAAKYYPAAADYKKVVDWLTSQGFSVHPSDKCNLSVFASGSVRQVGIGLGIKFVRVNLADVESTSASSAPSLPVTVAGPVLGINGLQPQLRPRTHSSVAPAGPTKLTGNSPPYTVPVMLKAYQGSIADGTGQTIAIVIDTFPANSDLTKFWIANSIGQSLNNIQKVQVVSGNLPSPSGEETLDVEWSSGIAPGAKVRVYATTDLSFSHLDQAYQAIINDLPTQPNLHEVSLSYGLGETYMSLGQMQTDDQYFASLAAAGVTVFVSSGDGGSSPGPSGYGDTSGPVQVESPASDPNVTAVGGTSLLLNASTGALSSESAWSLGGGGSSKIFSRPVWQIGTGVPAGTFRLVPDVALVADLNTGGYLVLNGQVCTVGGTSWSAPSWAGICARINQVRSGAAISPLGLLGPKIYPLLGSSNFRDITAGSNGSKGVYNAGKGFDLCTGLGVPVIDSLLQTLGSAPGPVVKGVDKDFNGDGNADLVWENSTTGARAIWMLHNCVQSSTITLPTVAPSWHIAGVGDFLGNGQAGLVWEDTATGEHAIWILNNGVFDHAITLATVPAPWHVVGAGDFNGDGYADLVWENSVTGAHVIWFLINGAYSSALTLPTVVPATWHIAAVGDFLGTGQSDLVWEDLASGNHAIWIFKNGALDHTLALPPVAAPWHIVGAGDFNGDGYADLVLENTITGGRAIWLLVKGVCSSAINLSTVAPTWHIADH